MADDPEFEMLVNVLKALTFIRNAEGWLGRDPTNAGRLNDAKHALQHIVDDCTEENQRLAGMSLGYDITELVGVELDPEPRDIREVKR